MQARSVLKIGMIFAALATLSAVSWAHKPHFVPRATEAMPAVNVP
jgi:hypothetical protein